MKKVIAIIVVLLVTVLIMLCLELQAHGQEAVLWKDAGVSNQNWVFVHYSIQAQNLLVIKFTNVDENRGAKFTFTILFEHEVDGKDEYYDIFENKGKTGKTYHVEKGEVNYYTLRLSDVSWFKKVVVPIYDLSEKK